MSPRTPDQFEQIREQSRDKILRGALSLFARFGYERTSVRMIARETGVAQGLMYNYFRNKQDLFRAIFERSMADVRESFAQAEQGTTPGQRLEHLIRSSLEIVRQNREFWTLSYSLRTQPAVLQEWAGEIGTWSDAIRSEIEAIFRAAEVSRPAIEAAILFALIDGVAQHSVLEPKDYPLDEVISALVAKYRDPAALAPC